MRNVLWIALTTAVLATGARADEPAAPPVAPEPAAPPATPGATLAPYGSLLPAPYSNCGGPTCGPACAPACAPSCAPACTPACAPAWAPQRCTTCCGRCPTCGKPMACASSQSCEECGKRQRKVARFLDWLIYVPLDHGKTKCCACRSEPPPAWSFFPCEGGGRCQTCVASAATVYYAKAAGATTSSQVPPATAVVQTAYPPKAALKLPDPPPSPVSAPAPRTVAPTMPVLDPSQFRRAAAGS